MPIRPAFSEFEQPRPDVRDLPPTITDVLPRLALPHVTSPADPAEKPPASAPDQEPYFEIYRAERVSLTSILFSGGDWRWRFCAPSGAPIAAGKGYASESHCAAAVAALRSGAGGATVRTGAAYKPGD
ncbi:YegP family protein [Sphingomonas cannabina]|uniref:YegP family protein n=1 Tax=Sphingomonas cannabina TaxID=2899123 RepID=UPI001F416291|nr:YegP family protein [Sphingomonas cannabina]UIJ46532.1 YegP family protein [Sphingomonas cannabina]